MDKENIIAGEEKFKNIDNFSFQVGLILTAFRKVVAIWRQSEVF